MMKKEEILRRLGSMQQAASVRPVVFEEGRSEGMKALLVRNGALKFQVLADKGMDLGEVSYRGINVSFLAKPGLMGRNHFDTHGAEAQRSIMGGMMFTAGLENICPPCVSEGKEYPMHGRIRTTPAEHVCSDAVWKDEEYVITVSGEMREAELFGENMVLRRKITTAYPGKSIVVEDVIENQSFREEPMMLLYHCNVGWPLLGEDCEIVIPTKNVIPRDQEAAPYTDAWNRMEAPRDNEPEYVFLHEMAADENGDTFAAVINPALNIGLKLSFNIRELPYFMQWKSRASGDYVVGLEPANSSVYGRLYHEKRGDLHRMASQTRERKRLTFTFLEDGELMEVKEQARRLMEAGL